MFAPKLSGTLISCWRREKATPRNQRQEDNARSEKTRPGYRGGGRLICREEALGSRCVVLREDAGLSQFFFPTVEQRPIHATFPGAYFAGRQCGYLPSIFCFYFFFFAPAPFCAPFCLPVRALICAKPAARRSHLSRGSRLSESSKILA